MVQHVHHCSQEVFGRRHTFPRGEHVEDRRHVSTPDQRKEVPVQRKQDEQQNTEPEHRHRQPEQGDEADAVINERVAPLQRGQDASRQAYR